MIVFIVERQNKEELLRINKLPFTFGSEDADFVDESLQPKHFVIKSANEAEVVVEAFDKVVYNNEELKGEIRMRINDELEAGEVKLTLVSIDLSDITTDTQSDVASQPTQFLDIEEIELPYLKLLSGPDAGKVIEIDRSGIIGRDPSVEYVIEDPYVSRRQAKIYVIGDRYELEDVGGKNPTLVNGKVVQGRVELHSGDELQMGKTRLLFVNPKEKPESEIFKSRGIPKFVYGIIGGIILVVIGIGIFLFMYQRQQSYSTRISLAKGSLGIIDKYETTEQKVKELESAYKHIVEAQKIKNTQEVENLRNIIETQLKAWKSVQEAEKLIEEGNLEEALSKLEKTSGILINKEEGLDDPYVSSLYSYVLKSLFVKESYATAKVLLEQGKPKEALQVLNDALARAPEHPQLLELRNIIVASQKRRLTKRDISRRLAKLKEIKPKPTKETQEEKASAQASLKPKFDLDVNLDLEVNIPTIEPTIDLGIKLDNKQRLREAYAKGDLKKVLRIASEILQDNPNDATAKYYQNLARLEMKARRLEQQGRREEALRTWKQLQKADPSNRRAKEAVARLSR